MRRIFIETPKSIPSVQIIGTDVKKYLKQVLRLTPGQKVECFDGKGKLYSGILNLTPHKDDWAVYIDEIIASDELKNHKILILSAFKLDRLEIALEKCSEIGITEFIICQTKYSQYKLDIFKSKLKRLELIISNACRQSERLFFPKISIINESDLSFLKNFGANFEKIVCTTEVESEFINKIHKQSTDSILFIGPEGGFDKSELETIINYDFIPCKLSRSILRSETAAVVGSYEICI